MARWAPVSWYITGEWRRTPCTRLTSSLCSCHNYSGWTASSFSAVTGAVVSCVVPPLQVALRQMTSKRLAVPSVFVEPGVRTGMPVLVDNPKEVGADRIADAVAAFERYGGPTIVVDFGTATNFEVVSDKGEYLGGVLFPGVEVSLDALTARAALLPRVDMVAAEERPR